MSDMPEWEYVTYRVEWVFMIGTIGDSEGRTWAKELVEEKRFSTKEEAEAYRDNHPDLVQTSWGSWKTNDCYGLFAIVRKEVRADAPLNPAEAMRLCPEVAALVDAVRHERYMVCQDMGMQMAASDAVDAAIAPFTEGTDG